MHVVRFSTLSCISMHVYKIQSTARVAVCVLGLHVHSGAVCVDCLRPVGE